MPAQPEHGSAPPDADEPEARGLFLEVYAELRALAAVRLRHEVAGHTLQPTALVHEVYLKLADQSRARWRDRGHFFAVAAEAIRRILVDHARRRGAAKREAPGARVSFHPDLDAGVAQEVDLLALDDALERLGRISPRQARVVELRFFGGLEVAEVARELAVSENTVKGDWRIARAWLQQELAEGPAS
jgi:RNA polymerase sigma-70 factor, ECF subfamily